MTVEFLISQVQEDTGDPKSYWRSSFIKSEISGTGRILPFLLVPVSSLVLEEMLFILSSFSFVFPQT
jgi:hypothetical protein